MCGAGTGDAPRPPERPLIGLRDQPRQLWALANGSSGAVFQFVRPPHPDHSMMISAGSINRRRAFACPEHASWLMR